MTHPQHLLELFWAFQFDPATQSRVGVDPLDEDQKRLILAKNYARLAGLDLDARLAAVRGAAFDRQRADEGLAAPWSLWRQMQATTAA